MKSSECNRRKFLGGITASAAAGALINTVSPISTANAQTNWLLSGSATKSEYLFAHGLTYMNTGTLGPCRRDTIEEATRIWEELESLPVKFYGGFGAESLAEKTRTIAARFLGCDLSEIVMTNSTTSGMNAVAQGLRLKTGDRILTTNHEHGGGLLGWKYLAKYYGAEVDVINIPPAETYNCTLFLYLSWASTSCCCFRFSLKVTAWICRFFSLLKMLSLKVWLNSIYLITLSFLPFTL